eukprot:scaffold274757_cov27-Tisochrysis_lutea.AAC.2
MAVYQRGIRLPRGRSASAAQPKGCVGPTTCTASHATSAGATAPSSESALRGLVNATDPESTTRKLADASSERKSTS